MYVRMLYLYKHLKKNLTDLYILLHSEKADLTSKENLFEHILQIFDECTWTLFFNCLIYL